MYNPAEFNGNCRFGRKAPQNQWSEMTMRFFICATVAILVALTTVGKAFAEAAEGQSYFSVMGSYIDDDDDRGIEDGINGGQFAFGYAFHEFWNAEALFQVGRGEGNVTPNDPTHNYNGIGIDLQRVFRRDERFSPYLHAGLGYFMDDPSGADSDDGSMYSAGVGFYYDLFSTNLALRGEWRFRTDSASSENLSDNLLSFGLQLPFGSAEPAWVDSDGDGVSDGMDRCPNTPAGADVDAYGCELDSDGDGVKDSADECPDTPTGVRVDSRGCATDSDGDGVTDENDECPNTPAGARVDEAGCELDSDSDSIVDRLDECPNTAPGDPVDRRGCTLRGEYVLQGTAFETNSDRLTQEARSILDGAVETLTRYPDLRFEIGGHTDSTGSTEYNESLSTRRARSVHDYFASKGIATSRMTVRGYGESSPIATNDTEDGRAQNRRVSLRVIEN
jgi:OOP family OmpA-OmpF porin